MSLLVLPWLNMTREFSIGRLGEFSGESVTVEFILLKPRMGFYTVEGEEAICGYQLRIYMINIPVNKTLSDTKCLTVDCRHFLFYLYIKLK